MPQSRVRFIGSRELHRDLPKVLDSLEDPDARFVLTIHSKPKAVLIGAEAFLEPAARPQHGRPPAWPSSSAPWCRASRPRTPRTRLDEDAGRSPAENSSRSEPDPEPFLLGGSPLTRPPGTLSRGEGRGFSPSPGGRGWPKAG